MPDDKQRGKGLTVLFENSKPNYNLDENLSSGLDRSSARATLNAWANGSVVDGTGKVWIMEDFLFAIWRTDKATASYFVDGISDIDKSNFNGSTCINYSAVIYRLNEIIDGPITDKRRGYLRLSEDIGQSVRDSDAAEVYRLKYNEHVNGIKKEMKNRRIEHFGIENDELTGSCLNKTTAEFHHIRRQSTCPDLISMIWNGLIVNKNTHNIITSRNVNDEYDLLELCEEQGWNTGWFNDYQTSLKRLGMQ